MNRDSYSTGVDGEASTPMHSANPYRNGVGSGSYQLTPPPTVTLQDLDALVERRLEQQALDHQAERRDACAAAWEAGRAAGHHEGYGRGLAAAAEAIQEVIDGRLLPVVRRLRARADRKSRTTIARERGAMVDEANAVDAAIDVLTVRTQRA